MKQLNGLTLAAYILMIICTVFMGVLLVPLAWCIPMTIHYKRTGGKVSIGFKVCALLFMDLIPGILMLCDSKNVKK